MLTNHRIARFALAALVGLAVTPISITSAQSLGDVARRSDQQKQGTSKVYTNENLAGSDQPAPTASPAEPDAAAAKAAAEAAPKPGAFKVEEDKATGHTNMTAATATEKRDEQYWRRTVGGIRIKVAVLERDIALQEERLDAVEGDSPTAVREREVFSAAIAQMRKSLDLQRADLTRWLTRAGIEKVPEEWTRVQ